jgi:UDP:flavonoid glycosyltransferase YjiC (YdhE family)
MAVRQTRKVLFVTPPGYGHVLPTIPLAWAVRAAGHEILVATCGVSVSAVTRAGLPAVNVAVRTDLPSLYAKYRPGFRDSVVRTDDPAADVTPQIFVEICDVMTDEVVRVAREWRADLIVHTPDAAAALIAAACLAIPAVFLGVGLHYTPEAMQRTLYAAVTHISSRWDVGELAAPVAWIDTTPPSLRGERNGGWPMRTVQYNGGALVEASSLRNGHEDRARVAVTMGTAVPFVRGVAPLRAIVDAARGVDATFVVAHGLPAASALGPLPPNVQATSWIGFDVLLPTCHAAIHHGGSGTTMAVLSAGLPQLVVPQGSDQFANAAALRRRGVAIVKDEATLDADVIADLLASRGLATSAAEVRAEVAAMPPPAEIVPRLLDLVA